MQEKHPDQGAGPGTVTQLTAGGVPEPLMNRGEPTAGAGGHQRGRPGQGPGLTREDLQGAKRLD